MGRTRALLVLAAVTALFGFAALAPPAAAQDAPATITFRISKYSCPTDPGRVSPAVGNIPEECDPVGGVTFTVALEDGTVVGTCTTDATGLCQLQAPNEATVVVTEDVSTVPAGYRPRENPITTRVVTEFAGALFINLPQVTTPPKTGVGFAPVAAVSGAAGAVALGASGLAILAAATASGRRRRTG